MRSADVKHGDPSNRQDHSDKTGRNTRAHYQSFVSGMCKESVIFGLYKTAYEQPERTESQNCNSEKGRSPTAVPCESEKHGKEDETGIKVNGVRSCDKRSKFNCDVNRGAEPNKNEESGG